MNELPIEAIVILCGIGVVAAGWLLLRFGRAIARVALVGGVLAMAIIVGLVMLGQATATKETAQAVQIASAGQATTSAGAMLCAGALGTLTMGSLALAGVFYIRLRLTEDTHRRRLPRREQRPELPGAAPLHYVVEEREPMPIMTNSDMWGW